MWTSAVLSKVSSGVLITLLAVSLALLGAGVATLVLFSSPSVEALTRYTHGDAVSAETLATAEQTRRLTVGIPANLPVDPGGVDGFDQAAISHLIDVRAVLRVITAATAVLAAVVLVALAAAVQLGYSHVARSALRWSGVGAMAVIATLALTVLTGFDRFFTTFHELLFTGGNWQFPHDSLLIRTFPQDFWVAASVGWLGVVLAFSVATTLLSTLGARRPGGPAEIPSPE